MNSDEPVSNTIWVKILKILSDFQSDLNENPSKQNESLRDECNFTNLESGTDKLRWTGNQSDLSENASKFSIIFEWKFLNESLKN